MEVIDRDDLLLLNDLTLIDILLRRNELLLLGLVRLDSYWLLLRLRLSGDISHEVIKSNGFIQVIVICFRTHINHRNQRFSEYMEFVIRQLVEDIQLISFIVSGHEYSDQDLSNRINIQSVFIINFEVWNGILWIIVEVSHETILFPFGVRFVLNHPFEIYFLTWHDSLI